MVTAAQVAERDGTSTKAVTKKVRALAEEHGLTVERDGRGRIARFHLVEYDHLRAKIADPSKAQGPRRSPPALTLVPAGESYDEALRQKTWHEAEKRRLELDELKRSLVPVAALVDATDACGEAINAIIDRLPNLAEELAAVVARDGAHGLRQALKKRALAIRTEIAAGLEALAVAKPADAPAGEARPPQAVS